MGPNRDDPTENEFVAALDRAAAGLEVSAALDPPAVAGLLQRIGDVLRLRQPLPPAARRGACNLPAAAVNAALKPLAPELRRLSAGGDLSAAVHRRDQLASVGVALTWLRLRAGWSAEQLPVLDELGAALAACDQAFREKIDRRTAEALLGSRARLQDSRGWTSELGEGSAAPGLPAAVDGSLDLSEEALRRPPSEEAIAAYIGDGTHRRTIEAFAARDPDFAATLAACVDAVASIRQDRCLLARLWRSAYAGDRQADDSLPLPLPLPLPLRYEVTPQLFALAAASDGEASDDVVEVIPLGPLAGVAAEATLEVRPGRADLFVFSSEPLAQVALGSAASERADQPGRWSVSTALRPGPLAIRVVAAAGGVFEVQIDLAPAGQG